MDSLAQIVCLRPNGRDPRTVVAMGPRQKVLAQFQELQAAGWEGKKVRPILEVWNDGGAKIAPTPDKTEKKK